MSGRQKRRRGGRPRNGHCGKSIHFAARNALHAAKGKGRFATTAAHRRRFHAVWEGFCRPLLGWRQFEDATAEGLQLVAAQLSEAVQCGRYSIAYAHNLISSLNVVLRAALGPAAPSVSAVQHLGPRSLVREEAPGGMDPRTIISLVASLEAEGLHRAAAIVLLSRFLGMRLREALLADIPRLVKEARAGAVNVQNGTKGGRRAPRWVPVTPMGLLALDRAARASGDRINLLAAQEQLIGVIRKDVRSARRTLRDHGIRRFHDLRAAYGCERYRQITGHDATVFGGPRPPRAVDQAARRQIAKELGHGRPQIAGAYIGGWLK